MALVLVMVSQPICYCAEFDGPSCLWWVWGSAHAAVALDLRMVCDYVDDCGLSVGVYLAAACHSLLSDHPAGVMLV